MDWKNHESRFQYHYYKEENLKISEKETLINYIIFFVSIKKNNNMIFPNYYDM